MNILVSACLLGLACRYDGSAKEYPAVLALAENHTLIPFCPEIYGGLSTPREPCEIIHGRVRSQSGVDVTPQFEKGAQEALRLATALQCKCALLQDRSPSCGVGIIHDGTFTGGLVQGDGLTARLLMENNLRVLPATRAAELAQCQCPSNCRRHGDCIACREHHRDGTPSYCQR